MSNRARYSTNFISSAISIGLVLFLLGFIGLIILHAQQIAKHVRENITVTVMLKDDVREADLFMLQKSLDLNPEVLSTLIVTPEEAAQRFTQETGEDFVGFLGYIPLPYSIEVHVKSEFATATGLQNLQTKLKQEEIVKDVYYEKDLVEVINDNIFRISIILLSVAVLLLLISIVLINNTMRLHIYSKRFIIKSMLLVGASHSFIRKPFLKRGFYIGLVGSVIASLLLYGTLYFFQKNIPDLQAVFILDYFLILLAAIALIGIFITIISTIFSVRKYVRIDQDSLYK